jgi:hypothetical protein
MKFSLKQLIVLTVVVLAAVAQAKDSGPRKNGPDVTVYPPMATQVFQQCVMKVSDCDPLRPPI